MIFFVKIIEIFSSTLMTSVNNKLVIATAHLDWNEMQSIQGNKNSSLWKGEKTVHVEMHMVG